MLAPRNNPANWMIRTWRPSRERRYRCPHARESSERSKGSRSPHLLLPLSLLLLLLLLANSNSPIFLSSPNDRIPLARQAQNACPMSYSQPAILDVDHKKSPGESPGLSCLTKKSNRNPNGIYIL